MPTLTYRSPSRQIRTNSRLAHTKLYGPFKGIPVLYGGRLSLALEELRQNPFMVVHLLSHSLNLPPLGQALALGSGRAALG